MQTKYILQVVNNEHRKQHLEFWANTNTWLVLRARDYIPHIKLKNVWGISFPKRLLIIFRWKYLIYYYLFNWRYCLCSLGIIFFRGTEIKYFIGVKVLYFRFPELKKKKQNKTETKKPHHPALLILKHFLIKGYFWLFLISDY